MLNITKLLNNKNITNNILKCFNSTIKNINNINNKIKINTKHKIPQKRASALLNQLKNEEFNNMKNNRNFEHIRAGDSVEIEQLLMTSSAETEKIRGVVIGIFNKYSDTSMELVNCEYGTPIIRRIIMYNPLIKDIKILQKRFIRGGERRVRRSKLYYLYDRDPQLYTVAYK